MNMYAFYMNFLKNFVILIEKKKNSENDRSIRNGKIVRERIQIPNIKFQLQVFINFEILMNKY